MALPLYSNLIDALTHHATHTPTHVAYRLLDRAGNTAQSITYRELATQVNLTSQHIQRTLTVGERALLLYDTGIDFVIALFACLQAGVIAIPIYPPQLHVKRVNMSLLRLHSIVEDAAPNLILTTAELATALQQAEVKPLLVQASLADLPLLATDDCPALPMATQEIPRLDENTVAMLQYTSGSTGNPKGVQLTHGNIINDIYNIYRLECDSFLQEAVCWLPLYHDMGIVGGVFMPLYGGIRSTLISALDFLRNPLLWLRTLSSCTAVMSGGPDFAYQLCWQRVNEQQLATLDLRQWKVAYVGGETNRVSTFERFVAKFARCGFARNAFHPCYGLAEATVYVTGASVTQPPVIAAFDHNDLLARKVTRADPHAPAARRMLSVGRCFADHQLIIVDPNTHQMQPTATIGEIWLSGPSVSPGYWSNPRLTHTTFQAMTQDGRGPYLRTGDLGFLVDEELYIYGRDKDLIIIRGRTIPPQDIEWALAQSDPRLHAGGIAAFALEHDDREQLIVVAEIKIDRDMVQVQATFANMRECISRNFSLKPHTMVLIKRKTLPKTTSGKVRRSAACAAYLNKQLMVIASCDRSGHISIGLK